MYDHCCIDGDHLVGLAAPGGARSTDWRFGEREHRLMAQRERQDCGLAFLGEREHGLAAPGEHQQCEIAIGGGAREYCLLPRYLSDSGATISDKIGFFEIFRTRKTLLLENQA